MESSKSITAVEWLVEQLRMQTPLYTKEQIIEIAKEMESRQKDEFAIGFAEWLVIRYNEDIIFDEYTTKELLEIYKKEKGL